MVFESTPPFQPLFHCLTLENVQLPHEAALRLELLCTSVCSCRKSMYASMQSCTPPSKSEASSSCAFAGRCRGQSSEPKILHTTRDTGMSSMPKSILVYCRRRSVATLLFGRGPSDRICPYSKLATSSFNISACAVKEADDLLAGVAAGALPLPLSVVFLGFDFDFGFDFGFALGFSYKVVRAARHLRVMKLTPDASRVCFDFFATRVLEFLPGAWCLPLASRLVQI
ncbi:hypothetical protein FB567DRAFT_513527 [Paraphoma chrysanthemicola]|uniref:Uncharacterized protein n=1 Tax=Paraphoma chrysanthemicola TaxID=798071 RepID=A0A8K0RJV6_9PLEO|nr:hypothetical protein FB567DRAFT_513527 [Paraphoma chrysanthemicola]